MTAKEKFEKFREVNISEGEYNILLLSYPLYLVASADGDFDTDEKDVLKVILGNFIESIYGSRISDNDKTNLIVNYIEDFEFLKKNEETFKISFLQELKNFNDEVRESIKNLIDEVAETSNGIVESEKNMIEFINTYL